jgi:biopolymer transport protein ExbD
MGRRGGFKRYMDKRSPSTFKIQITSMVDMFVILLVFLLRSYSTSPIQVTPSKELTLPESSAQKDPEDILKIVVSQNGIFLDDQRVVVLEQGQVGNGETDSNDPMFIRKLYEALDKQAEKSRSIAKVNDTVEFDGKILMQADRALPYSILEKVMYTSTLAGYSDLKLAVVSKE